MKSKQKGFLTGLFMFWVALGSFGAAIVEQSKAGGPKAEVNSTQVSTNYHGAY